MMDVSVACDYAMMCDDERSNAGKGVGCESALVDGSGSSSDYNDRFKGLPDTNQARDDSLGALEPAGASRSSSRRLS